MYLIYMFIFIDAFLHVYGQQMAEGRLANLPMVTV
jgi:hypothetical protein